MNIFTTNNFIYGFIFRIIISLLILLLPFSNVIKILLIFLCDHLDCSFIVYFSKYNKSCSTYLYQILDKIVDALTYLFVYYYFKLPNLYLYLALFRFIGVMSFGFTKNSKWLIVFPDIFKEIWIFDTFISNINIYNFALIYICKDIFEYIWHTHKNINKY
jgi:hypothetical protein